LNPKTIYLITSLPIPGLPPTELLTLTELLNSLKLNNSIVDINFTPIKKPAPVIESSLTDHDPCERTFKEVEQQTTIDSETERGTFFEFFEKQLWFFEKWKSLIFTVESALQEAKAPEVQKCYIVLYKKLSLLAFLDFETDGNIQRESDGQISDFSKRQQNYRYETFIKTLKLSSKKYSIPIKNSNLKIHLTIHFTGADPTQAKIEAEYEKFIYHKENGTLFNALLNDYEDETMDLETPF